MLRILLGTLLVIAYTVVFAQSAVVSGKVADREGKALVGANILVNQQVQAVSDSAGRYRFELEPGIYTIEISFVGYRSKRTQINLNPGATVDWSPRMRVDSRVLDDVRVIGEREDGLSTPSRIERQASQNLPSAFGDFSKTLVTLPGVVSNNELSSRYQVRGGNFDENLVYINEIPVYRPFLSVGGQQEGLSVVNPDLVEDIQFYPGGWSPRYGDKLSSSLNIRYKRPEQFGGRISLGLLGGSASGDWVLNDRLTLTAGIRHRDSRYLLNTTEVQGQYFPTYSDAQTLVQWDLSDASYNQKNRTRLEWFSYIGRNRYLTLPESQTTVFGSILANFRIETAFAGREILNYDIAQSGINFSHLWTDRWLSRLIVSSAYTREREYYEVEGAYRLCDIDQSLGANDCAVVRGIGSNYRYGRNRLDAWLSTAEFRNEWLLNDYQSLELGVGVHVRSFDDEINEFAFADSADFVDLQESTFNSLNLKTTNFFSYLQHTLYARDSAHAWEWGVRLNRWSENGQWLVSPRLTYRFVPNWQRKTSFRLSTGWYQQFPIYRELRGFAGQLRADSRAQRSIHLISGMERTVSWWGRPFHIQTELYYKWLYDLIPYDIDNVRIRYYDQNNAFGYAAGLDARINGEFIPGTQSWFSLSYLTTRENVDGDNDGYVRRPTDQRLNLAVLFQDHVPNDPTLKVYLNLVYGSGFPVGPPNNLENRNAFQGDEYYRTDLALSKVFTGRGLFKEWEIRLEILNALAADNTLSYNWIEDVNGDFFAIPNALSARFLNIRIVTVL